MTEEKFQGPPFHLSEVAQHIEDGCATRDADGNACSECRAVANNLRLAQDALTVAIGAVQLWHQWRQDGAVAAAKIGDEPEPRKFAAYPLEDTKRLNVKLHEAYDALAIYARNAFEVGAALPPAGKEIH